jgi:hypothetical protein
MRVEGDGAQNSKLFKRLIEKVMRELLGNMRLAGKQHSAFHEYKDPTETDYLQGMQTVLSLFSWLR